MMIREMATIFRAHRKIETTHDLINPGDRPRRRMKWALATMFLLTISVSSLADCFCSSDDYRSKFNRQSSLFYCPRRYRHALECGRKYYKYSNTLSF